MLKSVSLTVSRADSSSPDWTPTYVRFCRDLSRLYFAQMDQTHDAVPVEFPGIWDNFGGSIFRGEYRSDFAQAEKKIAEARDSLDRTHQESAASLDFVAAIHCILAGQIRKAEGILDRSRASNLDWNPQLQLRYENYRGLITQNGAVLRAFDNSLDFSDFQTNIMRTLHQDRFVLPVQLQTQCTHQTNWEKVWIFMGLMAITQRTNAAKIRPCSPIHPQQPTYLLQYQRFVEDTDRILSGYTSGYPHRLRAEIARIGDQEHADNLLDLACHWYTTTNDPVGQAACILLRGDWKISPVLSNLTALNLVICESTSHNGSAHWDEFEDGFELPDLVEANRLYDEAMTIFENYNAKRGVAAVHLRKACLLTITLIHGGQRGEPSPAQSPEEALEHLKKAKTLSEVTGDLLSSMLVSVHDMIIRILTSPTSVDVTEAANVGELGTELGCFQHTHDLGLLLLRLGNFI